MTNSEFFRGFCFGLGQSVAGIIIVGVFGERICKYVFNTMKDIEKKETKLGKEDLTMQNIPTDQIKNCDESLLSDGETIQIKPKISIKNYKVVQ